MQSSKLSQLELKLYDTTPLIGSCIRIRAARKLTSLNSPESFAILAQAYCLSQDRSVKTIALEALRTIDYKSKQNIIDAICAVWERTRHQQLTQLLIKQQWIAMSPAKTRVLTALKVGKQRRIARTASQIVKPLLATFEDLDPEISTRARECALNLENRDAINYICEQWCQKRDPLYEQIILQAGYFATSSIEYKVLTALKINRLDLLELNEPETIDALLKNYNDPDSQIRDTIAQILRNLKQSQAQQLIIDAVIQKDDSVARKIADTCNYLPDSQEKKVLYSFFTDQPIDNIQLLQEIYLKATEKIKQRIHQKIASSREIKFLTIVNGELDDNQWQWLLELLKKWQLPEHLWYYAQRCPLYWSKRFLLALEAYQWQEAKALINLAKACQAQLPIKLNFIPYCQKTLLGHNAQVTALAINQDNNLLASGDEQNTIYLWDINSNSQINTLIKHQSSISQLSFTPDGLKLISASKDKNIQIWTLENPQKTISLFKSNSSFVISSDGKFLATVNSNHRLLIYTIADGKMLFSLAGHIAKINTFCFSPNDKYIATGSQDKTVKLWNVAQGKLIDSFTYESVVNKVIFSRDNLSVLAGLADGTLKIRHLGIEEEISINTGSKGIDNIFILKEDQAVLTSNIEGKIRLWQLLDGHPIESQLNNVKNILQVLSSPNGNLMITLSDNRNFTIWDMDKLSQLELQEEISPISILSSDDKFLLTTDREKIKIYSSKLDKLSGTAVNLIQDEDIQAFNKYKEYLSPEQAKWLELLSALATLSYSTPSMRSSTS